jgi:hypothetical protein
MVTMATKGPIATMNYARAAAGGGSIRTAACPVYPGGRMAVAGVSPLLSGGQVQVPWVPRGLAAGLSAAPVRRARPTRRRGRGALGPCQGF